MPRPANKNYTKDNFKLATIHSKQIRMQHVQKLKTLNLENTVYGTL